jgi:hypothetical protein
MRHAGFEVRHNNRKVADAISEQLKMVPNRSKIRKDPAGDGSDFPSPNLYSCRLSIEQPWPSVI